MSVAGRRDVPGWIVNVALSVAAVLLAYSVSARAGRAGDAAAGLDGSPAIRAVVAGGFGEGDAVTRGRPLVPLIVRAVAHPASPVRVSVVGLGQFFDFPGDETTRLFTLSNLAYTGLLAALVCLILDAGGASAAIKGLVVFNLFATMALARLPAYQPVQIELGACVFITLAVYAVIKGARAWIVAATVLAVLAREAGLAVVLFGLSRDRQRGTPTGRSIATYAPAIVAFVAVQIWAHLTPSQGPTLLRTLRGLPLVDHPELLVQPSFVVPALYGAVTLFGGVSLLLIAKAIGGRVPWADARPWIHYLGALGALSLLAGLGAWTFLAYSLPAVVALFARTCAMDDWRRVALATGLATLCTQRSWAPLSDPQYLAAVSAWLPAARDAFAAAPHAVVTWGARAGFVAWFVWWASRDARRGLHAPLGLVAAALLLVLGDLTGAIAVNNGYGYDGEYYVRIIRGGFEDGTPNARLRPLIVVLVGALDRLVFHDPIAAFRAANLGFAAGLAVILADLCRRYGASWRAVAVLVMNLFLCISTAKLFAFYPTLIDLGALTFMAACVWAIVTGRRVLAGVTVVLAALSREFAAVVVLFGVVRDIRLGRPLWHIAATYAPGVAAIWWVRRFAAGFGADAGGGADVLSLTGLASALVRNLQWWADPLYAVFWIYFALTLFGGLSLAIAMSGTAWRNSLRREPEWLAIVVPMLAVTALAYLDTWRYLVFVVPAIAPLWAWCVSSVPPRRLTPFLLAVSAATHLTQRPWQRLDVDSYFRDWFPYYLVVDDRASALRELWPAWRWHAAAVVASILLLVALRASWRTTSETVPAR